MTRTPFITFDDAPLGLAAEMGMFGAVAGGAPASAFLWQARSPWLVLPERFGRGEAFETAAAQSAREGWPVATRKTGGGITPQGPGVLNVALAFQTAPGRSRTVRDSYAAICDAISAAMGTLGITTRTAPITGSFCDGDYNLAVGNRKIVGTAQRWRGNTCLCHALILTDIALGPAVGAVQRLSLGLGHANRFETEVHCRLADLTEHADDLTEDSVQALWQALAARGYAPWTPDSADI